MFESCAAASMSHRRVATAAGTPRAGTGGGHGTSRVRPDGRRSATPSEPPGTV